MAFQKFKSHLPRMYSGKKKSVLLDSRKVFNLISKLQEIKQLQEQTK